MLRLQTSWILDSVNELLTVKSIFMPFFHRFTDLNRLVKLNQVDVNVNSPVDTQSMLARAWFGPDKTTFYEKNIYKFNQVLSSPLDTGGANPFIPWINKLFTRTQIDYLYYWRECAYEMEDEDQREIFWSSVYFIISYWLSNKKHSGTNMWEPDKIMAYYLHTHNDFIKSYNGKPKITNTSLHELEPITTSLTIFPLLFDDDDTDESKQQTIFYAWNHGTADIKQAKNEINAALNKYMVPFNERNDYSLFSKLASKSDSVAFMWSGNNLAPKVYEEVLADPIRRGFNSKYKKSKLLMKAVDKSSDSYDYLLILY